MRDCKWLNDLPYQLEKAGFWKPLLSPVYLKEFSCYLKQQFKHCNLKMRVHKMCVNTFSQWKYSSTTNQYMYGVRRSQLAALDYASRLYDYIQNLLNTK